jgi:hypothetical protein
MEYQNDEMTFAVQQRFEANEQELTHVHATVDDLENRVAALEAAAGVESGATNTGETEETSPETSPEGEETETGAESLEEEGQTTASRRRR